MSYEGFFLSVDTVFFLLCRLNIFYRIPFSRLRLRIFVHKMRSEMKRSELMGDEIVTLESIPFRFRAAGLHIFGYFYK